MKTKTAILGASWGDECKARLTHSLASRFDWVVKFNGGANCGATVYVNGKKYVHHLTPVIDCTNPDTKGFLGAGMAIHPPALLEELEMLEKDFPGYSKRLAVDPDAFAVMSAHIEEDKVKNAHIGTTNRGVGPTYTSKVDRRGTKIKKLLGSSNEYSDVLKKISDMGVQFKHSLELKNEFTDSRILFEGSQSVMLDINHGNYPFVTSSDCTVSGIYSSGFNFIRVDRAIGVAKAYTTRVGNGPFPTELEGEEAEKLRERGSEYGASTGRPRRVGWLDLPQLRYAVAKGGITCLTLAKLDILNGMKFVPVADSYHDGEPMSGSDFFDRKPHLVNVPGWSDASTLDKNVMNFVNYVEKSVGVPVDFVSTGVNPSDLHRL